MLSSRAFCPSLAGGLNKWGHLNGLAGNGKGLSVVFIALWPWRGDEAPQHRRSSVKVNNTATEPCCSFTAVGSEDTDGSLKPEWVEETRGGLGGGGVCIRSRQV